MIFKKEGTYDKLKTVALIMPLFIVLYEAVGKIWGIPYTDQITMTLTAINAFIGGLVKIANVKYNKMEVDTDTTDYDEMLVERDDE